MYFGMSRALKKIPTKINIMKTTKILLQPTIKIVLLIAALLFSSGIFAQKSFNQFEMKNVSSQLIRSSSDIIAEITSSFRTDVFIEEQIMLEDWMVDLNIFATNNKRKNITVDSETGNFEETKLELEGWMMDINWDYINNEHFKEDTLKLEKWMCCPQNW